MRTAGFILLVLGIIGTIITGVQALRDSEVVNFLGIEIGVSTANWTPVIISVVVLLAGILLLILGKRR